jgi:DNA-binding PadR family transcriptional regulator
LARKKVKGTPLRVFSGKEERLNRVILQILKQRGALIPYDVWLIVKGIKGFRNTGAKTVYRRMEALELQGWIATAGNRPTKPGWPSKLYVTTLKGRAALELDEKSIEDFLKTATGEQLLKFIDSFS